MFPRGLLVRHLTKHVQHLLSLSDIWSVLCFMFYTSFLAFECYYPLSPAWLFLYMRLRGHPYRNFSTIHQGSQRNYITCQICCALRPPCIRSTSNEALERVFSQWWKTFPRASFHTVPLWCRAFCEEALHHKGWTGVQIPDASTAILFQSLGAHILSPIFFLMAAAYFNLIHCRNMSHLAAILSVIRYINYILTF